LMVGCRGLVEVARGEVYLIINIAWLKIDWIWLSHVGKPIECYYFYSWGNLGEKFLIGRKIPKNSLKVPLQE